jgi:hypothetical protein
MATDRGFDRLFRDAFSSVLPVREGELPTRAWAPAVDICENENNLNVSKN